MHSDLTCVHVYLCVHHVEIHIHVCFGCLNTMLEANVRCLPHFLHYFFETGSQNPELGASNLARLADQQALGTLLAPPAWYGIKGTK